MKLFKIVKDNKPSLRQRCEPISFPLDESIKSTLLEMLEYLKLSQDDSFLEKHPEVCSGVGLAAPQIGINKQMVAIYFHDEKNVEHSYCLINPRIVSESVKKSYLQSGEGCLSVDAEHQGYVYRSYKITVKAYDLLVEKDVEYVFTGFAAIVAQHEIDHLKGVLFYDHIDKKNPFKVINGAVAL